ncbi:hypothetical protein QUF80_24070, partial [Desulfococcaceae bacterium HSG8]|nr:hypothetical protein [Desulfococcaceae bacterium HSG8]
MFSKKTVMIAGIIILVGICITVISISGKRGYSSYGSGVAMLFISPFQETVTHSIYFVRDIWKRYFFLVSAAKENSELRKSLRYTKEENTHCDEIKSANIRLRGLLDFRENNI